MRYNFKSKKGFITNVVTQQGEGYLTGGTTKRDDNEDFYIRDGRYTTCDDHDCPHFYFQLTKAKVRPAKHRNGPRLHGARRPAPALAVPFGFFPFTDSYSSGVIVPTFGDDYQRGFYLRDGGYYFAISDNMDLALTGEIYTKGSWGLRAQSSYVKATATTARSTSPTSNQSTATKEAPTTPRRPTSRSYGATRKTPRPTQT